MTAATADRALTEHIRALVVEQLGRHPDRDRLELADQRQLVRGWIEDQLGLAARRRLNSGHPALRRDDEIVVAQEVENLIWGLGRLQTLLDRRDVEDIHIIGAERPVLRLRDGTLTPAGSPVADSDEDLIAQLQHLAAHHGGTERAFSPAQPLLNMQLPDGSRLAAIRDVVPHPSVTIRRHHLVDVTLDDLAGRGMLSRGMLGFLRGVVAARRSILVTGMPASGKTTLLRALARDIPAGERVATLGNRVRTRPAPPRHHPAGVVGDGVPPGLHRARPGHRTTRRRDHPGRSAAPHAAHVGHPGDHRRGPRRRSPAHAGGDERGHARLHVHPARRLRR